MTSAKRVEVKQMSCYATNLHAKLSIQGFLTKFLVGGLAFEDENLSAEAKCPPPPAKLEQILVF